MAVISSGTLLLSIGHEEGDEVLLMSRQVSFLLFHTYVHLVGVRQWSICLHLWTSLSTALSPGP